MKSLIRITAITALILCIAACNDGNQKAEEKSVETGTYMPSNAKYAADVPDYVLTPDKVESQYLGELNFFDGTPSKESVEKVYDFLDVSRGVDAFLNGIPAASIYALLEGFKKAGLQPGDLGLFEELMDARSLFLTPNSTTMYGMTEINVKDGPVVLEIPPGVLGPMDDAYFRWVTDVGITGPDGGKGGKYLIMHTSYEGQIPEGYFEVRSPSFRNLMFFRAFIQDGDLAGTAAAVKAGFKCYTLAEADNPPEQKYLNLSGVQMNTIHANDYHFFEELNAVIQYEPADSFDPELVGQFAAIGIKKGQPFNPDERMKKLLNEAVAIGNASARAISYRPRNKGVFFYDDRQWNSPFAGMSHEFYNNGERVLDDRIFFHYVATGITPAMANPKVGKGSVYAFTTTDSEGEYLYGGNTYSVTLPAPIPINNFWSFMVYSNQHRSMLETDQKLAGVDNLNPEVKANDDGSYTVWFGPEAPEGKEANWVQTVPGKSYSVLLRLYGPLEPWFDKSWKPGDFILEE